MKALILAAGRGSRMKELTQDKPKSLVKLGRKTLLEWQLDAFYETGINSIGIVSGYMRDSFQKFRLQEFHNKKWDSTNMVESLLCARDFLHEEDCIVSYSDIFFSSNAISLLVNTSEHFAVTYDTNWREQWSARFANPLDDAESFLLDSKSYIVDIGQKVDDINLVQGQYMGLFKLTPFAWEKTESLLQELPVNMRKNMYMTDLLRLLITSKTIPVKGIPFSGMWGEIDSQSDLAHFTTLYEKEII